VELACTTRFTNLPIDFFAVSSNFGTIAKFAVTRERPAKYEDFSHKVHTETATLEYQLQAAATFVAIMHPLELGNDRDGVTLAPGSDRPGAPTHGCRRCELHRVEGRESDA